jgi:polyisoprenoid-binding protein YceI
MKKSVRGNRVLLAALAVVFTSAVFAAPSGAQTSTWQIDPAHANAQFTVRHLSISNVSGQFNKMSGTVQLDDKDITKSSVNATIDVSSVDTRDNSRDGDLKSDHFFDVAKYPTMTFTSTQIESAGPGKLKMTGNLTLHGVTKSISFPAKIAVSGDNATLDSEFFINRQDFGITYPGKANDLIRDEVVIKLAIHASVK